MIEIRKYVREGGVVSVNIWLNGLKDKRAKGAGNYLTRQKVMTSEAFNTEDYLKTPEDIAAYLDAALEDGDERVLLLALRQVASVSGGMGTLAKACELNRESLYKTLSNRGNPRLETISAILKTMGLRLSVTPVAHHL